VRLEVGGSNPYISRKKIYLDRREACGGGRLVGIFFLFSFAVLEFFSNFFMFWKIICRGGSSAHPLLQIICRDGHITHSYKSDF